MTSAEAATTTYPHPAARTLAVVVTAGVTPYLHRTLSAVAGQTALPPLVLVVDVASRANTLGDGTPVEEVVAESGLDAVAHVRVVRCPAATGFGSAVSQGLERYTELVTQGNRRRGGRTRSARTGSSALGSPVASGAVGRADRAGLAALAGPAGPTGDLTAPTGALSPITATERAGLEAGEPAGPTASAATSWLWLLHDDSAPDPACLAELVTAVTNARSVALAGPKQVDWDHPDELLEVGLRTTASARRANDIVAGEVDQGQHDDRSDVLAVGTAGALIARGVWEELGGTSPSFPVFGDGLELSRAVRLAGHRVVVVPTAVIRHRRAAYLGMRPRPQEEDEQEQPPALELDPDRSFRERRAAQLTAWATFSSRPTAALLAWFVVLGAVRAVWRLLTKVPQLASDELVAALEVARRPGAIRAGRRRLSAHQSVRRSVLGALYVDAAEIRAVRRDTGRQERERAARAAAPSELELRELAGMARRRRRVLALLLALTTAVAAVGLSRVLLVRTVNGGALASLGSSWRQTWDAAWSTWAGSGDGYASAIHPLLAMLALPMALGERVGLSGDALVHVLLVVAIPLAALGAWFAAGTMTRRTSLRGWAALVWALSPTLLLAVGQGRLTAVLVHLALPWALAALSRAVGADRRDVVLSGLVGAHRATQQEKDELDQFASERIEDLADLADPAASGPAVAGAPDRDATSPLTVQSAEEPALSEAQVEAEPVARPEPPLAAGELAQPAERAVSAEASADAGSEPADSADATADGTADPAEDVAGPADGPADDDPADPAEDVAGPADGPADDDPADPADGPVDDDPATPVVDDARGVVVSARTAHGAAVRAAATEQYGPGSPTAAAVAGLLLALVVAAAPALALPVTLGLLLLLAVGRRHRRARLLLSLAPVLVTAAPAWWRAWQIARGTGAASGASYLLTDAAAPIGVAPPSGLDALLGVPVDLDSLLSHPTAALLVRLALALLPALALTGLLTRGRRGHRARTGALMVLAGLALALLAARTTIAIGTLPDGSGTVLVRAWSGTGITLATAGMLASVLAGADAARSGLVRHAFGWRHLGLAAVSLVAALVPLLLGAAWAWTAHASTATGTDAQVMALHQASSRIPVIAAQTQQSPSAGRVLLLTATDEGIEVDLWRGDGTTMTDVLPDVLAAELADRAETADLISLGAAGAAGASEASGTSDAAGATGATGDAGATSVAGRLEDDADSSLADIVSRALAGQDARVADDLAHHGVAVVVLTDRARDETTASAKAGLDATTGLEELARTASGMSWRVTPDHAEESARAALIAADGSQQTLPSTGTGAAADVPASSSPSTLVLAERSDDGWSATLDGRPLEAATAPDGDAWRQAYTVPASGGHLVVTHGSTAGRSLTRVVLAVWALTALAALPLRRRRAEA